MSSPNGARPIPRNPFDASGKHRAGAPEPHAPADIDASIPYEINEAAFQQLEAADRREGRSRSLAIGVYGGVLATGGAFLVADEKDVRFEQTMPFVQSLQDTVNGVQEVLQVTGGVSLAAASAVVIGTKIAAIRKPKAHSIDSWSSHDMSEDRLNPHRSKFKKGLEAMFAGKIPLKIAAGAYLATLAATVSTEVSNGPQRPIETVMAEYVRGDSMVVNYAGAMPMVESTVSRKLVNEVSAEAIKRGVRATIFDQNLGQMVTDGQTLSDLVLGVSVPENTPISYNLNSDCKSVPVAIDRSAGLERGDHISLNGVNAEVVQEVDGISATNRVGIVMDAEAMAACLKKSVDAPVHSIVLDAPLSETREILKVANKGKEVATVKSVEQYAASSKAFWEANVKPITSVLALFAGLFAASVGGSNVRESLIRNRREWAAKLGSGNGENTVRATEGLRVLKDGILASIVGGGTAVFTAPIIVNTIESGFQASAGAKEFFVGSAVAITGSLAGATKTLLKPKKVIKTEESIRS